MVCLGSPTAMFMALRAKREGLKVKDTTDKVRRWFNVFYHHDPVAFRLGMIIMIIREQRGGCIPKIQNLNTRSTFSYVFNAQICEDFRRFSCFLHFQKYIFQLILDQNLAKLLVLLIF